MLLLLQTVNKIAESSLLGKGPGCAKYLEGLRLSVCCREFNKSGKWTRGPVDPLGDCLFSINKSLTPGAHSVSHIHGVNWHVSSGGCVPLIWRRDVTPRDPLQWLSGHTEPRPTFLKLRTLREGSRWCSDQMDLVSITTWTWIHSCTWGLNYAWEEVVAPKISTQKLTKEPLMAVFTRLWSCCVM